MLAHDWRAGQPVELRALISSPGSAGAVGEGSMEQASGGRCRVEGDVAAVPAAVTAVGVF